MIELNKIDVREPRMADTKKKMATAVPLICGSTTVYSIEIAGPLYPFDSVYSIIRPVIDTVKLVY